MKTAATISRYLLGLLFTVFGLNGFLHFIPQPSPTSQAAIQYLTVLSASHYFVLIFLMQLVAGLLLLVNRFVPLALTMLAPILVNVLLFHSLMDPAGLPVSALATILWLVVFLSVRPAFAGLFQARTVPVLA